MTTKEPTYEELKARLAKVEAELSALRGRLNELCSTWYEFYPGSEDEVRAHNAGVVYACERIEAQLELLPRGPK